MHERARAGTRSAVYSSMDNTTRQQRIMELEAKAADPAFAPAMRQYFSRLAEALRAGRSEADVQSPYVAALRGLGR